MFHVARCVTQTKSESILHDIVLNLLQVAERIIEEGCITGDRINGLCDGVTGDWYCKFDTFHPAVDRGLPVTRVISRIVLQVILLKP